MARVGELPSAVTTTFMSGMSRKVSGTMHCAKRTGNTTPFFSMLKRYSHG